MKDCPSYWFAKNRKQCDCDCRNPDFDQNRRAFGRSYTEKAIPAMERRQLEDAHVQSGANLRTLMSRAEPSRASKSCRFAIQKAKIPYAAGTRCRTANRLISSAEP